MKQFFLSLLAIGGILSAARAMDVLAEASYKPSQERVEKAIIDLFNSEVAKPKSALSQQLKKIHQENLGVLAGPEVEDVIFVEGGFGAGQYHGTYAVLLRFGYKSNTTTPYALIANSHSSDGGEGSIELIGIKEISF